MTFFELLQNYNSFTKINTITYMQNGNDVHAPLKQLVNVSDAYNDNNITDVYAEITEDDTVILYRKYNGICIEIQVIYDDREAEQMEKAIVNYCNKIKNYDDFKKEITLQIENGQYIKNDVLYLLKVNNDYELFNEACKVKEQIRQQQIKEDLKRHAEEQEQERAKREAEKQQQRAEKQKRFDFLMGFAEGKTDIQREKIYTILSKVQNYDGKFLSRRDFILQCIKAGFTVDVKKDIVYYTSRGKWGEARKTKPKTEYRLIVEGGYYLLTKTEYKFYMYMVNKGFKKGAYTCTVKNAVRR